MRKYNPALTLESITKHVEECGKWFLHTSMDIPRSKKKGEAFKESNMAFQETFSELRYLKDTG